MSTPLDRSRGARPRLPARPRGLAHSAGRTWLIAPSAIRAISTEPESSRGDLVLVHLFDRKEPIPVCASAEWLYEQITGEAAA